MQYSSGRSDLYHKSAKHEWCNNLSHGCSRYHPIIYCWLFATGIDIHVTRVCSTAAVVRYPNNVNNHTFWCNIFMNDCKGRVTTWTINLRFQDQSVGVGRLAYLWHHSPHFLLWHFVYIAMYSYILDPNFTHFKALSTSNNLNKSILEILFPVFYN